MFFLVSKVPQKGHQVRQLTLRNTLAGRERYYVIQIVLVLH